MIKLLILDVDGCLSDGGLTYSNDGIESKTFNVKDGLGITTWIKIGHQVAIVTGRESEILKRRSVELGIQNLHQGIKDKDRVIKEIIDSLGLRMFEVAAIGDDLNDYNMLSLVGRSFTPADGVKQIRKLVDTILLSKGGEGAVREMIDIVVTHNDQEEAFINVWTKE